MAYVDGFVLAVPTKNRNVFRKYAKAAATVFKEHGALKVIECWGNDVPDGETTSFPKAVMRKHSETVVFAWVLWPSRQARDTGMALVREDARMQPREKPMPFDGKRLIYGGFDIIVEV